MPATPVNAQAERDALALFDAALDVSPDAREAWLSERCAGDTALLARVRALLHADAAGSVLASGSAVDGVAAGGGSVLPPAQVGPYHLEELIGSGGMGAVYRASRNDGLFEQTVAIKFVRPLGGRVPVEALIDAERRLLARMQHPGIARILDGGTTPDGLHYLVMEFVRGLPIDEHAKRHELDARRRVALLREVCDAVADAHRHLVLHCDLKPANILVDESGAPKLIDFGIARLRDAIDPALPHGFTRDYASPQRLAGEPPTVADDVYALGVLLVELLTGQRPGNAAAAGPDGALDAELAAIARQALAESPRRYASVDAFAADLQRWLALLPVAAFAGHWRYRAHCFSSTLARRAGTLSLSGLVVALAVIATLVRADAARRDAEQRFGEVRSLANYMLFDLDARLNRPQATAIRRGLVQAASSTSTRWPAPPATGQAAARGGGGLRRLAEIQVGHPSLARRARPGPPSNAPKPCSPRWCSAARANGPGGATSAASSSGWATSTEASTTMRASSWPSRARPRRTCSARSKPPWP
jgi:serine/threonine-protein kinase